MNTITDSFALESFREYLTVQQGCSPNTVSSYLVPVEALLKFMRGNRRHFLDLDRQDSLDFIAILRERYSTASQALKLSALRHFYRFLAETGHFWGVNWWEEIKRPRVVNQLRPVISVEEMLRLLKPRPSVASWLDVRNRAIIAFLYGTGLRVSEAASVKLSELDLNYGLVYVHTTKNSIRAKQNIPSGAMSALTAWLSVRDQRATHTERLFVNSRTGDPLNTNGLRNGIRSYARKVGLGHLYITPHMLRKSACTHLYNASKSLEHVRKWARHLHVDTTVIYLAVPDHEISDLVARYHPLSWD